MRHAAFLLLIATVVASSGCGNVTITGALQPASFVGTVSIVRLTVTNDGTQVTFVTLISNTTSQDLTFCGNVVSQFPMNSTVQGSFTPGTICGTVVRVTITG